MEGWPISCRRSPRVVAIASAEVVVTVVQGVRSKLIVIIVVSIVEVSTGGLVIISAVVPSVVSTATIVTLVADALPALVVSVVAVVLGVVLVRVGRCALVPHVSVEACPPISGVSHYLRPPIRKLHPVLPSHSLAVAGLPSAEVVSSCLVLHCIPKLVRHRLVHIVVVVSIVEMMICYAVPASCWPLIVAASVIPWDTILSTQWRLAMDDC